MENLARQLTVRAVIAGMLLGGFMSLSNLYISLKVGWSFGVSITAGILAFAIFEVLQMNDKVARLVLEHRPAAEIEKQAQDDGMLLMKQDGYLKVLEGITTIEEVLRVAQI